jgi:hypothetical protein
VAAAEIENSHRQGFGFHGRTAPIGDGP